MSSNMDKLSRSMADFAVQLFQKASGLAGKDENVFLSPFSVAYALAMCYAGANTSTKDEMKKVLFGANQDSNDQSIHDVFAEVMSTLNNPKSAYKLSIANRLYANKKFAEKLLDNFVQLLSKNYSSEMQLTDFQEQDGEVARKEINEWVEGKTNKKIQDLIAPGIFTKDTRLVLVNAIYFKGDWLTPFEKQATEEKPFYSAPNKEIKLETMHKYDVKYAYEETDEYQLVGIPYEGQELAMFIFLPKDRYGLEKLEKGITGETVLNSIVNSRDTKIEVIALPKFKLLQSFSLANALKQMGAKELFTDDADFSNITGKRDLKVSDVIHKAFVEVNEQGTEAAAATAIVVAECMCMPMGPSIPKPKFIADHPFLFTIFDERSKSFLFLGRYTGKE